MTKKRTIKEKKELNSKIAEIIWLSLSGIIILSGLLLAMASLLIDTISGNFKKSPLYFLIEMQDKLFAWIKTWWADYPFTTFSSTSLLLLGVGLVFLLLVLLINAHL